MTSKIIWIYEDLPKGNAEEPIFLYRLTLPHFGRLHGTDDGESPFEME